MRFRFLDRFRLSPRTVRKVKGWGTAVLNVITYPLRLVVGLFKWISQTIAEWWEQRNLRFLLQGLPALIFFCGVIVFGATIFFHDRNALATDYQWRGQFSLEIARQNAIEQKEYRSPASMAKTCFKRLSILQPDRDENSFHMALVYSLLGQQQAVKNIIASLAPLDKRGYGPAHLIVGEEILRRNPTAAGLDQAEVHLRRAIAYNREPYASDAQAHLARICFARNRPEAGVTHLVASVERAANPKPQNRFDLARLYRQQGKKELAQRQLNLAAETLRKKLDEHIEDHGTRAQLIDCLVMLGEFEDARELCIQGKQIAGTREQTLPLQARYDYALYRVFVQWYDARTEDSKFTVEQRIALLESALRLMPGEPEVLQRLLDFVRKSPQQAEPAQEILRRLIDAGKQSAAIHLILGNDAWQNNAHADARNHWEKALELYGDNPQAVRGVCMTSNNLAWALAFYPPVDLERALELIEAALRKENDPKFRGTRGHILAKMGRHKEAVNDLEIAKPAHPNDSKLFRQLAESCEKSGLTLQAEHYKKVAEDLEKKATKPNPAPGQPSTPDGKSPGATPGQPATPGPEKTPPQPKP